MQGQESFGRRAGRVLVRFFVFVLVVGLAGAVLVLLSQLNSRTFLLQREGDRLLVHRGRLFPYGTIPYSPSDPRLADAYAPLPVAGATPGGVVGQRFEDRESLDRALFQLLSARAEPLIEAETREAQQQALAYLRRAQLLNGITTEQRRELDKLLADAAFFQGKVKLDDARRLIAEAMTQLRLAADSENKHTRSANRILAEVGAATRRLEEALRVSVYATGDEESLPPQAEPSESATPSAPPEVSPAGATDAGNAERAVEDAGTP